MSRKPENITYAANDKVPPIKLFILGLQHIIVMSSTLVLPAILIATIHGTALQALYITQASMLAIGIGTIVMGFSWRWLGSGYLCPLLIDPSFYSSSYIAASAGGLGLFYGMNFLIGVFQTFFAGFAHKLQRLFPFHVTGVVILMIGVSLITPGIKDALGVEHIQHVTWNFNDTMISLWTLTLMVAFTVWGGKHFSLYALIIGTIFGCIISAFMGDFTLHNLAFIDTSKLFALPIFIDVTKIHFSYALIIPFLVAALSSCLKNVGNLTACQKINDADWTRANMQKIRKGIFTNGFASLIAAFLGGMPSATSSSNIGLSIATKVTSRYVCISAGIIFVILALMPKLAAIFVIMPRPVQGAILIYVTVYMIQAGLQIMMSRMMDARKIFTIGLPIIVGLGFEFIPKLTTEMPKTLQNIFSSPLTIATILAIVLNLVFQIGISKSATLEIEAREPKLQSRFRRFLERQGALWGALPHTIQHATQALTECLEAINTLELTQENISIFVHYDEFKLVTKVIYSGPTLELEAAKPAKEAVRDQQEAVRNLAINLLLEHADKVLAKQINNKNEILIQINQ